MIDYKAVTERAYGPRHNSRLPDMIQAHIDALRADIVGMGSSPTYSWYILFEICAAIAEQAEGEEATKHRYSVSNDSPPYLRAESTDYRIYRG